MELFQLLSLLLLLTGSFTSQSVSGEQMLLPLELPADVKESLKSLTKMVQRDDFGNAHFEEGEPIGKDDYARAANLSASDFIPPHDARDPIADSGHFEGDIVEPELGGRNAIIDQRSRWPGGIIPYTIAREFDYRDRGVIARAMQEYHSKTCIQFVPKQAQHRNYIQIQRGQGCSSLVGMRGGVQPVSLGYGCVYVGIAIHELMHATGFYHEQSRADRDSYIQVMWQNIQPGMQYNFAKYTLAEIQHLGEMYDYQSVMHYGSTAFSKDNYSPTLVPLQSGVEIGQRDGFSQIDINKIRKLYECDDNMEMEMDKAKTNKP